MASPPPASMGTYSSCPSTATKRGPPTPDLVPNPFIKKRNLEWSLDVPAVASSRAIDDADEPDEDGADEEQETLPPRVEAAADPPADADEDRAGTWSARLAAVTAVPFPAGGPRLSVAEYRALYEANAGRAAGAHFVVTQHDHPIAGTHYDLRLQINATSSASWALMYGLPGAPNGARQGRMAVETRVHCLWNHLLESASPPTGSLLIWDTGTYSILEQPGAGSGDGPAEDPDSQPPAEDSTPPQPLDDEAPKPTEQQKLHAAFQARKIRLQLHGTRLPRRYVVNLRLTKADDAAGRDRSAARPPSKPRRRPEGARTRSQARGAAMSSDDESGNEVPADAEEKTDTATGQAQERRAIAQQHDEVRRTNEYPGARNSIGSVYQRNWFVSLDREASGFVRQRRRGRVVWEPTDDGRQERSGRPGHDGAAEDEGRLTYPFFVRGPEVERSLVTGRLGAEVLRDDGVEGFVSRKGWRAVLK